MTDQTTQETMTEKRITFEELVAHGIASGGNVVRGMPWSFTYEGLPVTHENDDLYLIGAAGDFRFSRDRILVTTSDGRVWLEDRTSQPSPTAARGVTGLPTWEELERLYRNCRRAYRDYGAAEGRCGRLLRVGEARLQSDEEFTKLLRTLLSAAEQGARDREDAELLAWLEAQEGDVEADLRPAGLPVASEAWHEVAIRWKQDGALPALPIHDVLRAARQPRQEGN